VGASGTRRGHASLRRVDSARRIRCLGGSAGQSGAFRCTGHLVRTAALNWGRRTRDAARFRCIAPAQHRGVARSWSCCTGRKSRINSKHEVRQSRPGDTISGRRVAPHRGVAPQWRSGLVPAAKKTTTAPALIEKSAAPPSGGNSTAWRSAVPARAARRNSWPTYCNSARRPKTRRASGWGSSQVRWVSGLRCWCRPYWS
jgi:hypothetical protein